MNLQLQKEQNKGIVRLHNNFVEAIFNLTADAKKLLLVIWLHSDCKKSQLEIYQGEIFEKVGIDFAHLNTKHREEIIEELMAKIVTIREINNPNNWQKLQLIRDTEYKNGLLKVDISPKLLPYIEETRERLFTRFNIQNIKPLTSIHAIRLYLIAKKFDDTGWYEKDLNEFKEMMELGNKYYRIYDLKKYVLEVAKKQINANTDINIDFELIKIGRSYKKIKLYISKNEKRIEKKETKKLIMQDKFTELEQKLNNQYRNKAITDKKGLRWFVKEIKVLNKNEVEITLTDLTNEQKIIKKINELEKIFT